MFGFGLSEIVIIMIVILVLIKPKDLPGIARKAGKIYATVIRQLNGIKRSFKEFSDEIETLSSSEEIKKRRN